jgi:hypothetical protein
MKTKRLLCPERLRRVPHQFSWIDQRLVRDGHISRCGGPHALAKTAARLLGLSQAELRQARNHLLGAGLIAYQDPLYQVLSLEPTLDREPATARSGQTLPLSAILRQILESGDRPQS